MSSAHQRSMTTSAKKIDELYDLIKGIEIAMFTTRGITGQLVSRPMATQDRIEGADLWFVTDADSRSLALRRRLSASLLCPRASSMTPRCSSARA